MYRPEPFWCICLGGIQTLVDFLHMDSSVIFYHLFNTHSYDIHVCFNKIKSTLGAKNLKGLLNGKL